MTLWDGETWRDPVVQLSEHPDLQVCDYPVGLEVGHERGRRHAPRTKPDGRSDSL